MDISIGFNQGLPGAPFPRLSAYQGRAWVYVESQTGHPSEELLELLLQRGLVSQATLDELLAQQARRREQALAQLAGIRYLLDPRQGKLWIEDMLTGERLKELSLSEPVSGPATAAGPIALFDAEAAAAGEVLQIAEAPYGLALTSTGICLYPPDPLSENPAPVLALSPLCLGPAAGSDWDLYACEEYVFVVDRHAGKLSVICTRSHQLLETVTVRPQGSRRPINLVHDSEGDCLYLTDNQSSMLYLLDLESFALTRKDIGLSGYALGNMAISPEGEHLYLLTLKPAVGLLYLELDSFELIKEIPVKGELLSLSQNQFMDPLLLTSAGHLLMLSTGDDDQSQAPLLTVIDAAKARVLKRFVLETAPAMLAVALPNPLLACAQSPLDLLLEAGVISQQTLDLLNIVDLDAPDAPDQGQGQVPTLQPQAAPAQDFAPELALPAIITWLCERFYQQYELDLRTLPPEFAQAEAEAERVRVQLETHDAAEVSLAELGDYGLNGLLSRQDLLLRMEQQQRTLARAAASPSQCPSCGAPLQDWDCAYCDLELESPERAQMRQQSSMRPAANLPEFHLLLADPQGRRLLLLDPNRTLDWSLDALDGMVPWQVQSLPNRHMLVVDRDGAMVAEIGPTGKRHWRLPQHRPELTLKQPTQVSCFGEGAQERILIVDQGHHRLLAVDRQGKVHWQYGRQGEAGSDPGFLHAPADLHWTSTGTALIADTGNDRVIEVDRADGRLLRSFGADLGLSAPVFAERLLNQHTLVVDAGNYRVLEFDEEGDVINECLYFKDQLGPAMRIERPILAIRGPRRNLFLLDQDKIIELLPHKRRLVWSSLLEHLARRAEILADQQETGAQYAQSFYQHKLPNMDDLIKRLRARAEHDAGSLNARLIEKFNQLLEVRRELDQQRALRPKARQLQRGLLSSQPLYLLDRTHHAVMQIDRLGRPLWHLGNQAALRLQRPAHYSELEDGLLIADTGNQRVIEVDHAQRVKLILGERQTRLLNQPRSAFRTLAGHTLIADTGNRRLIELNALSEVIWEYKSISQIGSPYYAAELGTGSILFVDWMLHMVKEIRRDGTLIWSYGQSRRVGREANQLSSPEYATRLPSGATLIADTHNDRVIEVAPNRRLLWEYSGSDDLPLSKPCFCKRLPEGNTLIAYDNYRQLLEVDAAGVPCWHFVLGNAPMNWLSDEPGVA